MNFFLTALPFLKVLLAFALMLTGIRNKLGLALSILLGGLFLGLVCGMPWLALLKTSVLAVSKEQFLFLAGIIGLIMLLSDGLERSGQSRRLMQALSGYLSRPRLRLIFFPALIGLLPMPGGAIFSAPMVKAVGDELQLRPGDQALINYWFRHVWEVAWPLYPGLILTVSLAGVPISTFVARTWPGVIVLLVLGWFFFLRPTVLTSTAPIPAGETPVRQKGAVLREGLPLLIAILGSIGLEALIPSIAPGMPFEWGVIAALIAALIAIMLQNRLGWVFIGQVLGKKALWSMMGVVITIFIFKDIMQAASIVEAMAQSAGGGVALIAAAVILPFLVGMVAGINVAFVGATFPLLLGLLHSLGMEEQILPYLVLASYAGFTGVMISPLHICFVLTCKYFGTEAPAAWKRVVAPCLLFLTFGVLLFFLLRLLEGRC